MIQCPSCGEEYREKTGHAVCMDRHGICLDCAHERGIVEDEERKEIRDEVMKMRPEYVMAAIDAGEKLAMMAPLGLPVGWKVGKISKNASFPGDAFGSKIQIAEGLEAYVIIPKEVLKLNPFIVATEEELDEQVVPKGDSPDENTENSN